MDYNYLGKTGIKVSNIGLGGMNFGRLGQDIAFSILDKAHDLGINFIDTANAYSKSEDIIGKWMNKNDIRDDMIINSKVGWPVGEGPNERGLSRKHILRQIRESLDKLQTDYIDIYQPHYFDGHEDLDQLVHLFDELMVENKIHSIGAPLFTRPYNLVKWYYLAKDQGLNNISSKMMTTSLLSRGMYDGDTRPIADDIDLGLITFGTLGGGLLTGKYHSKMEYPEMGKEMFRKIVEEGKIDGLIEGLEGISKSYGVSIAHLCFAWVLSHEFMDTTIIGVSSPEQLEDILGAQELSLSDDTLRELSDLSDQYKLW